jgi:hypothetical protein
MSLSCWIRSAFVKGWKEDDSASALDGEDIVLGFGCGKVRRTGNEDGLKVGETRFSIFWMLEEQLK